MASNIFAKIADIPGESADSKHKDEIEVLSVSWGVSNPQPPGGGGPGSGAGKATFQDLSFVHTVDKSSPLLAKACATGAHLKDATISHRKAGKTPQDYLIFKFHDVLITAVTQAGTDAAPPSEQVSLGFAKIEVEYKPQKPDGTFDASVHFKFDLKANKAY